ncbi:PREDICTED: uncharacterized protein LOC108799888 [Nanorana parkeri]|uniref:uncharacterized protein LOC108799888 n=1 Tax=Nanorana parkeri TaxID=125878 RepID=UPI0008548D34|nr:PREDICTED: uncharacterized protein LOC108799888 [Nanorana parkeri]
MPVILPQLPESMFSTYDPRYVPGYTGYTSKLRSDRGNIYGNATLQSQDYEPGLQRSSQIPVSAWRENYRLSSDLHLGGIISNVPRENAEIWNNKSGYYLPASGKYHIIRMNYTLDGDPKTSSAITAIEEIKYELSKPAKWLSSKTERCASSQISRETPKQAARCIRRADQIAESSCSPTCRNEMMKKTLKNDLTEKELSSSIPLKNNFLQRQGKIIYRTNSGLLPNYSGYAPAHFQQKLVSNNLTDCAKYGLVHTSNSAFRPDSVLEAVDRIPANSPHSGANQPLAVGARLECEMKKQYKELNANVVT